MTDTPSPKGLTVDGNRYRLDGEPFRLISGAIHHFRMLSKHHDPTPLLDDAEVAGSEPGFWRGESEIERPEHTLVGPVRSPLPRRSPSEPNRISGEDNPSRMVAQLS